MSQFFLKLFVVLVVGDSLNLLAGIELEEFFNDSVEEKYSQEQLKVYFEKIYLGQSRRLSKSKNIYLIIKKPEEFQTGCPVAARKVLEEPESGDLLLVDGQCKGHNFKEYLSLRKSYCADNNKMRFYYYKRKRAIEFRHEYVKQLMDKNQPGLSDSILKWLMAVIPEEILTSRNCMAGIL